MENGKIAPPQQHAPSPGQLADEFVFRLLSHGKEQKFNVFPEVFLFSGEGRPIMQPVFLRAIGGRWERVVVHTGGECVNGAGLTRSDGEKAEEEGEERRRRG